ncbi:hypothetical protein R5R35_008859 [Gryllus longicercus]|uniref:Uncharacterized protein n=1 Tax=Gryllus longicercus TaxID=2509291 RepID=A0AAN9Z0A0_9ORTH
MTTFQYLPVALTQLRDVEADRCPLALWVHHLSHLHHLLGYTEKLLIQTDSSLAPSRFLIKFVVLAALLAVANAGYLAAPAAVGYAAPALSYAAAPVAVHAPAIGASHQSTLRSLDGNSAVSHYSKAVDSAFSSVRKVDTRISNDAVALGYAPAYAASPVYHAAPVASVVAKAPVAAYAAAPAVAAYHAAPAVAAYAAPAYAAHAYAAPVAKAVAPAGLLGVAYSAAPAVTHLSFDGYGIHYGY